MTTQFRAADLTSAVVAVLTAASFTVGDGEKPAAGGWQGTPSASAFAPYVDVHPIPGGPTDGTIADPNTDAAADYQLVCVGATRLQAETCGDAVRAAMQSATWSLSNRSMVLLRLEMLGGSVRDDSVQPAVWIVSDRYRFLTVPS